jgi:peptidoglycan/xylan/chitin deacetylase (PgdA/CDA1 family)
MGEKPSSRMPRRAVVVGAALGLSACARVAPSTVEPAGSSGGSSSSATTSPAERPSGTPTHSTPARPGSPSTATGPAEGGPIPARSAIVARFAGRVPHQWSETATGVVRRLDSGRDVVALTFDLCGGPYPGSAGNGVDADLLRVLRRHQARATFFVNERWARANPRAFEDLAEDPLFEIANHGTRHLPLSVTGRSAYGEPGTRNPGEVYDEIAGNSAYLAARLGRRPAWFRGGTAFYDEVAVAICEEMGERVIGFVVNGDAGTTFSAGQIVAQLATARAGDIVISHANRPEHATAEGYAAGLPALLARLRPVTLSGHLRAA